MQAGSTRVQRSQWVSRIFVRTSSNSVQGLLGGGSLSTGFSLPRLFSVACICFGHVHKGLVIMGFISYVDLRFLVHVDVLPTMKF